MKHLLADKSPFREDKKFTTAHHGDAVTTTTVFLLFGNHISEGITLHS